jgi:hypothetical protein
MANIKIDPAQLFSVHFVADLPLDWQVIRIRQGVEIVIVSGSTTTKPPPPPDVAEVPTGNFVAGDTFKWTADLFAPPTAAANYTLNVSVSQGGHTIATDGPRKGNIAANGDKVESGSFACV